MSDTVILTETQQERALRTGVATPRFLQGVFPFVGRGLFDLAPLDDSLVYSVPDGKKTHFVYFRAGNACDALVYFAFAVNGVPVRYFPVGPNADIHVLLAIVEPHTSGETMAILFAAPRGTTGTLIVDVGLLESAQ
ncbi:MAG: molybdopterin oxidoreductase [Fibrella sp.]|nr:molybdopterin oxidoreductase [Armatimonadota bacterium]